jgi:hypothetical protein
VKLSGFGSALDVQEAARKAVNEAEAALANAKAEYEAVMMATDCEQAAPEEDIDCLLEKRKAEVSRFAASQKKMNAIWDMDEAAVAEAAWVLHESAECLLGLSERLHCAHERGQGRYGPLENKRALAALLDREQKKVLLLSERERRELRVRETDYSHMCEVLKLAEEELVAQWFCVDERQMEAVAEMRRLLKQFLRLVPFWGAGKEPPPRISVTMTGGQCPSRKCLVGWDEPGVFPCGHGQPRASSPWHPYMLDRTSRKCLLGWDEPAIFRVVTVNLELHRHGVVRRFRYPMNFITCLLLRFNDVPSPAVS